MNFLKTFFLQQVSVNEHNSENYFAKKKLGSIQMMRRSFFLLRETNELFILRRPRKQISHFDRQ